MARRTISLNSYNREDLDEIVVEIEKIENMTKDKRPDGMYELFWDLIQNGNASSYNESRIYYLAYLLTSNNIKVKLGFINN